MIGWLPAPGISLDRLAVAGQRGRVERELAAYRKAFGAVLYFSYGEEWGAPRWVRPCRPARHPWAWQIGLVARWAKDLQRCEALRVAQFTGALPAVIARARWGVPYVLHVGYDHDAVARARGRRGRSILYAALRRMAVPRAAAVIATSEALAQRLRPLRDDGHIDVIPTGVDLARFWPSVHPEAPPAVIWVGRCDREKRLDILVGAVGGLSAHLYLVGDGPHRRSTVDALLTAGVPFTAPGTVSHEDVPSWLRRASVFALPSETEGSPKALWEALASGLACVVSDRLPLPDGAPCLRVPLTVRAFGAALRDLLRDTHKLAELSGEAERWARRHVDLENTLAAEIAVVRRVHRGIVQCPA